MKTILLAADIYENGVHGYNQEWESRDSLKILQDELSSLGYLVILKENPIEVFQFLAENAEPNKKKDIIVFNLVEGYSSRNREAYIPALCEYLGFCHTGSDAYAQILSLDKFLLKQVVSKLGIPTANSYLWKREHHESLDSLDINQVKFPIFIKPNGEGSSLGVTKDNIIQNRTELESMSAKLFSKYDQLIVEEYIDGFDVTIGLSGEKNSYQLSEPARVKYDGEVYSEDIKSKSQMPESLVFDLDKSLSDLIKHYSQNIAEHLEISGPARFDYMISNRTIYFLELNLTPGLSKIYSLFPKLFEHIGVSYSDTLELILRSAELNFRHSKRFDYGKGFHLI